MRAPATKPGRTPSSSPPFATSPSPKIIDELAARFVDLEKARYATRYTRILDQVGTIEQQLHIGDLAAFTPPEINPPYD